MIETDEQRFHRELEESCAVEAVLQRTADLEASFAVFQTQQQLDAELVKQPATVQRIESAISAETPIPFSESRIQQTPANSDQSTRASI